MPIFNPADTRTRNGPVYKRQQKESPKKHKGHGVDSAAFVPKRVG